MKINGKELIWKDPHNNIVPCKYCDGVGSAVNFDCKHCNGNGTASGRGREVTIDCSGLCTKCRGAKVVDDEPCTECKGEGTASGDPKERWREFTQSEHDAWMKDR